MEIAFLIWIGSTILAGMIGARKDAAGLGIIAGIFAGPLGVLIMLAANGNLTECPFCKERIRFAALVCPHCQRDLPKHEVAPSRTIAPSGIKLSGLKNKHYFVIAVIVAIAMYIFLVVTH